MLSNWLEQLGNWNPQVLRELKGRLKTRNVLTAGGLSFLGQWLVFTFFYSYLPGETANILSNAYCTGGNDMMLGLQKCLRDEAGQFILDWPRWWSAPFTFLSLAGIFVLLVVGSYLLIVDMAQEQRRGTLNLLRLSPESSGRVLIGKLLGVPILVYLIAILAIPFHLTAGLAAGIPLSQILSFYAVLIASCGFFYSAALLYSLTTTWLGSLQALVGSGAIYVFLRGIDVVLHGYIELATGPFNWLELFSPGTALPVVEDSSAGMWIWLLGFSAANLNRLQWFHLPLGSSHLAECIGLILNFSLWTSWIWWSLQRCFRNANATILSKRQSYGLILCLEVVLLGFACQDFSIGSSRLTFEGWLHGHFLQLLFLNLLIFLGLIASLSPQRQALQDWARYRGVRDADGRRSWSRALVQDLVWGEKSPALVAIALNLLVAAAVIALWVLLWPSGTEKGQMLLQLGFKLNVLLIYAAVVQLTLFMRSQRRVLWATAIIAIAIVLPPILSFVGGRIEMFANVWLFALWPLVSLESVSTTTILGGLIGQYLVTGLLTLQLMRQLHRAGASSSKTLFAG